MLQIIRSKAQGVISWTIVLLVAVVFALFGLNNFFSGTDDKNTVAAKVNGSKIYWDTINQAYQNLYLQYTSHPDFDPEQLDAKAIKEQIRNALILQTALFDASLQQGYRVGKEQVKQIMQNIPVFIRDGSFSLAAYEEVLRANGLTDSMYQHNLRKEIILRQIQETIGISSFSTKKEIAQIIGLLNQKRDFGYVSIPHDKYSQNVKISEEEIAGYYNNHKSEFMSPEKIKISYVELNINDIAKNVKFGEEELRRYYNDNISLYTSPPLVKVSHIFINAPSGSKEEQDGSAKDKAERILAELKQKPISFAELVKKYSDDKLSIDTGGDLGWFGKGEVEVSFEDVAFALHKNAIAPKVVQTKYGYHILKVTDKKEREVQDFAKVKDEIAQHYKNEQAVSILADKTEEMANIAFAAPDSLEDVAKALNLKLQESKFFTKAGEKIGIASINKVVEQAFSTEVLNNNKNSELIKINDEQVIVLRLKDRIPSKQLELPEVSLAIKQKLHGIAARKLVANKGEQIAALIYNNDPALLTTLKNDGLTWVELKDVPRGYDKVDTNVMQKVFALPRVVPGQAKPTGSVMLDNGDLVVFALAKVKDGKLEPNVAANAGGKSAQQGAVPNLRESYARHIAITFGRYEYNLYQNFIRNNMKVKLSAMPDK